MIHRCRVHLLPGPAAAINHSKPGRAGHTPGPCIRPGLTWRARLTLIDANRVTVALTRNGLHVQSTVISRRNLGLPPLTPDVKAPQLEEEQGRARAQLLTGAASCILLQLSRPHPDLRVGLCGAKHWKSVALQVIASEPALMNDPEIRLNLLQTSVTMEPEYGLARLDYLIELLIRTPKTAANRLRFAKLMDSQLQLSEEEQQPKKGWEVIHMRILYSQTAMRINAYLMALTVGDERLEQLCREHGDILAAAGGSATRLTDECTHFATQGNQNVSRYATYMRPVAQNMQSAIAFLADEAHRRAHGGNWTWTPPEPDPYPSPKLATYYAALAGLADEYGVPRGKLDDALDYLAFGVVATRQGIRHDPLFWKLLGNRNFATLVEDTLDLKPVGMLDLAPFKPYVKVLTTAGITTFERLRLRTSDDTLQKAMAEYLGTSLVVVSYLADIAELAAIHDNLASAEVLQVFLSAGITSHDELRRRAAADRSALISSLTANAERYGLTDHAAFTTPGGWLDVI